MFVNPKENLKLFDLKDDMILVDLGAGTGFYSIGASSLLSNGKVYAVEINRDYIETIRNKAKDLNIHNLECIWGDIERVEGTHLANNIADRIIISNLLFQITDMDSFLKEVNRILKDRGKIMIIDYNEDSIFYKKHKDSYISKEKVKEIFEKNNFIYEREIKAGKYHYGIIFNKFMQ